MREITDLVRQEFEVKHKDTELVFSFIYTDNRGKVQQRYAGKVEASRKGQDDFKSLGSLKFFIGDFVSLMIRRSSLPGKTMGQRRKSRSRSNRRREGNNNNNEKWSKHGDKRDDKKDDKRDDKWSKSGEKKDEKWGRRSRSRSQKREEKKES